MKHSQERTDEFVGQICEVLIEGKSKKDETFLNGRNSQNTTVVFPAEDYKPGQYVNVLVEKSTATTLIGKVVDKVEK